MRTLIWYQVVHLAAVDAFDGEHVEDNGLPVDRRCPTGCRETQRYRHEVICGKHIAESLRIARHLHSDIKALFHVELFLNCFEILLGDVYGREIAQLSSEFQTPWIYIGDDDVSCTGVLGDCGCHDADRACTGDQDIFAENFKSQSRVYRVAKRVKYRCNIEIDAGFVFPDVGVRHCHILGDLSVFTPKPSVCAHLYRRPAKTVAAAAADKMSLDTNYVAREEIADIRANFNVLPRRKVRGRGSWEP